MATQSEQQARPLLKSIPLKVINGIDAQLKKLRSATITLNLENDNTRATLMEGEATVGGPYTHGQAVQAWVDGFRMGEDRGYAKGKVEGGKEGFRKAHEASAAKPCIYVLQTASTFHVFRMANNEWMRLDDSRLPTFNMGQAIAIAVELLKLTNFSVKFEERQIPGHSHNNGNGKSV